MVGLVITDGGRAAAGYKGTAGDCGVRAAALALGLPYHQAYAELGECIAAWRATSRARKARAVRSNSPRDGLHREPMDLLMRRHGWAWVPTMRVGSGTTVRLKADELPGGRLVCSLSRHFCAVIDGVVHDSHDPRRGGTRTVYGFWREPISP